MSGQEDDVPQTLVLEGAQALKLLAHEARQLVIAEIYDGRPMTATEAAAVCGLTPSAMSYHLRMLEKAGVLLGEPSSDGRERRYRRAARRFEVRGAGGAGNRVQLKATVAIWVDSLTRAIEHWAAGGASGTGGLTTESLRLTPAENEELVARVRAVFAEYGDLSEGRGPEFERWESYWAHVQRPQ